MCKGVGEKGHFQPFILWDSSVGFRPGKLFPVLATYAFCAKRTGAHVFLLTSADLESSHQHVELCIQTAIQLARLISILVF